MAITISTDKLKKQNKKPEISKNKLTYLMTPTYTENYETLLRLITDKKEIKKDILC